MPDIRIKADSELYRSIAESAVSERRPVNLQAEVMLRRAAGLPVPVPVRKRELAEAEAQFEDTRAMVEPDEALALIAEIRRLRSLLVDKPKYLTFTVRDLNLKADIGIREAPRDPWSEAKEWCTFELTGVNTIALSGIIEGSASYTIHPSELVRTGKVRVILEPVE